MASLLLEVPASASGPSEEHLPAKESLDPGSWLVFQYAPVGLFSLKMSRATSTAGKTLLIPTPYAAKMAFLDAALRHGFADDPERFVQALARVKLRIGVPQQACVTTTIQSIRQETRDADRKRHPELPFYRANIALREFVCYQGRLRFAFDIESCTDNLIELLLRTAPAINYIGKRGGFIQYLDHSRETELDSTYTQPAADQAGMPGWTQRTTLDDFGPQASFDALNSFSPAEIKRGVHRVFVETAVPLSTYNVGPGFAHYCAPGVML